jgi:2-dehydro-3-deoxygalactonokinase
MSGQGTAAQAGRAVLIGLDWGTSSLRAYRIDGDGRILERRASGEGILATGEGGFAGALARIAGDWLGDGLPVIASGMIGSRQGWREVPYLPCPAGALELGSALFPVPLPDGVELMFTPGLVRVDADGVPDVMRGEETQVVGAVAEAGPGPAEGAAGRILLLPGTHSKWVRTENGRVVWFATFMTGELFAVLARHSILGRLMEGDGLDEAGFAQGLAHGGGVGTEPGGLLRRLFSARTLALLDRLPGTAVRGYLSGLLIGCEIAEARACLGGSLPEVTVIGGAELAGRYRRALEAAGALTREVGEAATARGHTLIARRAGLIA